MHYYCYYYTQILASVPPYSTKHLQHVPADGLVSTHDAGDAQCIVNYKHCAGCDGHCVLLFNVEFEYERIMQVATDTVLLFMLSLDKFMMQVVTNKL